MQRGEGAFHTAPTAASLKSTYVRLCECAAASVLSLEVCFSQTETRAGEGAGMEWWQGGNSEQKAERVPITKPQNRKRGASSSDFAHSLPPSTLRCLCIFLLLSLRDSFEVTQRMKAFACSFFL